MVATIDNPSTAVEWTICEMINEPMILEKAAEELGHVVGRQRLVEERDMPQLNYLKSCMKLLGCILLRLFFHPMFQLRMPLLLVTSYPRVAMLC
ncbi:putative phenylalanine N-monooxygenase [Helianthus debilis subsp. tardiflorus]